MLRWSEDSIENERRKENPKPTKTTGKRWRDEAEGERKHSASVAWIFLWAEQRYPAGVPSAFYESCGSGLELNETERSIENFNY